MKRLYVACALVVYLLLATTPLAIGQDGTWGNLSGRLIYDGKPPKVRLKPIDKHVKLIGKTVPDESLVVNATNRGIANVVVYLRTKKDDKLRVHPTYEKSAKAKVTLSLRKGRFEPHIFLLRTTQTMVQKSIGDIAYNPNTSFIKNSRK